MRIPICCKNGPILCPASTRKSIDRVKEVPPLRQIVWNTTTCTLTLLVIHEPAVQALESVAFAGPVSTALRPVLFVGQSLMLLRIVLSWFPEIKETELPWVFAYLPTEPLLKATRKVIPPAFGVDISPVVWFAILSFIGEILIGPQGILNIIQRSTS